MNKKGFTLVELLAVITILSIILTITIYSVKNILGNSKDKKTHKTLKEFWKDFIFYDRIISHCIYL